MKLEFNETLYDLIDDLLYNVDQLLDYDGDSPYFNESSLHNPRENYETVLKFQAVMKSIMNEMKVVNEI